MNTATYRVVTIPKLDGRTTEEDQLALAHKFREFRLLALKTAPGAYATSYEDEARCGLDHTFERLRHPKATQFVALANRASALDIAQVRKADVYELLTHEWLGFVVLIGPEECLGAVSARTDPFGQITAGERMRIESTSMSAGHDRNSGTLRFHLNGMFVCPSVRRCGMGARLIEAALDSARLASKKNDLGFHCTIIVDEWNHAARTLYERVGFEVVARETYGEDRIALRMELRRVDETAGERSA